MILIHPVSSTFNGPQITASALFEFVAYNPVQILWGQGFSHGLFIGPLSSFVESLLGRWDTSVELLLRRNWSNRIYLCDFAPLLIIILEPSLFIHCLIACSLPSSSSPTERRQWPVQCGLREGHVAHHGRLVGAVGQRGGRPAACGHADRIALGGGEEPGQDYRLQRVARPRRGSDVEEIHWTVQESADSAALGLRPGQRVHETVWRRHQHNHRHNNRRDGGLRAGVSIGEEFGGAEEVGASGMPLVSEISKILITKIRDTYI